MNDYLDDGTEDDGTEGEGTDGALSVADLQPVTVESAKTGELTPLELADMVRRSRITSSKAASDLKAQIERARDVILQQPTKQSKADWLLGIGSTLLAPGPVGRAGTIGESLGALGKYVSDVSEQERKAKALQAQQLANFDLATARAEAAAAKGDQQVLASLISKYKAPAEHYNEVVDLTNRLKAMPKDDPRRAALEKRVAYLGGERQGKGMQATGDLANRLQANQILADPNASAADIQAAQGYLQTKDKEISKGLTQNKKVSLDYLNRLKSQRDYTLPDIDKALDLIDTYGRRAAGTIASDIKGLWIVGQPAKDLEKLLTSIKSAIGFEKLGELKKYSAQGASGLGAISNKEQELLGSSRGSIELEQSPPQLKKALERIKNFYRQGVDSELNRLNVFNLEDAYRIASEMPEQLDYSAAGQRRPAAGSAAPSPTPASGSVFNISLDAIRAEKKRREGR